jgi:hypothetical protein
MADGRWSVAVSLLVAAAMAVIASIAVEQAGCSDPGHYVEHAGGYELVGGCVEPGDLPVAPDTAPVPTPDHGAPVRP